jgi:hypothetical protein
MKAILEKVGKTKMSVVMRTKKKRCTSGPKCQIQITDSKHSNGNKEIVAISVEDWLLERDKMLSDGYADRNSSDLSKHLNREFQGAEWTKNSSQSPYDTYSVAMRVAVELKGLDNVYGKRSGNPMTKNKIVMNASLYSDEVLVRNVIPTKYHYKYTDDVLNSFMDVLVVCFEREKSNGSLLGYKIVDGNYWNISYQIQEDCRKMFGQLNTPEMRAVILGSLIQLYGNSCAQAMADGTIKAELLFRKLISVENPID